MIIHMGNHMVENTTWTNSKFEITLDDYDGDGFDNNNDSHPLNPSLRALILRQGQCSGTFLEEPDFGFTKWSDYRFNNTKYISYRRYE